VNKRDLNLILRQLGDAEPEWRSEHQVSICCPLAPWTHHSGQDSNPSLSLKYGGTPTLFKCFTCGAQGSLASLVGRYARLSDNDDLASLAARLRDDDKPDLRTKLAAAMEEPEPIETEIILDESVLDNFMPYSDSPKCVEYLANRRIPAVTAVLFGIRYDANQDRLLFPARNLSGGLVGFVGRTICDDKRKYKNYFGFKANLNLGGSHLCNQLHDTVSVVEGFMDILRAYQWSCEMSTDIVCTWTSDTSDEQGDTLLGLDKRIVMCYDNDAAGEKGTKAALTLLKSNRPQVGHFTSQDVGSMDKAEYVHTLNNARVRRTRLRA